MRRLEEERDILKAARYFARNPSEIPLHERAPTSIRDHYAVSGLQVARAGFYQWLHKPVSDREKENGRLLGLIRDSMRPVEVYGARRVFADLREAGESCGKHRVAPLPKWWWRKTCWTVSVL
jgi:putative transposase